MGGGGGYLVDVVVVDESGREAFDRVLGQLYKVKRK